MPDSLRYKSHLSIEAAKFVVELPKRQQRLALDLSDQIAAHPFQISDYQTTDPAGRVIENLLLDCYLFSYWVDHASREVRISEIVRV